MEKRIETKSKIPKYIASFLSVEILLVLGSFISFPIFTRLLDKSDYGLMNLISIALLLAAAVGSAGLPHSVYRFRSKFNGQDLGYFEGTIRTATISSSVLVTIVFILIACLLYSTGSIDNSTFILLLVACPLILIRVLSRLEMSFIRSQEQIRTVNIINVLIRYGGLIGSVCMVFWLRNLFGYYTGIGLAELFVLIAIYMFFGQSISCLHLDRTILKECFLYGFPLIFTALFAYLLTAGDRYVIAYFMDSTSVADYTVAYNFCNYPVELLRNTFMYAYVPVIMNLWNKEGFNATKPLLTNFISTYCWLIIPIIFGLSAIRVEGITLIAGNKYSVSAYLVPVIIVGIGLDGMNFIYTAGLMHRKKTNVVLGIAFVATIINIVLNVVLIPIVGLMGAAIATLITYASYMIFAGYFTFKENKFDVPFKDIVQSLCYGLIMYAAIMMIPQNIVNMNPLVIKITVGCTVYFSLITLFARSKLKSIFTIFRK